jgi:hypothetical protein
MIEQIVQEVLSNKGAVPGKSRREHLPASMLVLILDFVYRFCYNHNVKKKCCGWMPLQIKKGDK